jgi:UDP-glucose 4-epimerase
MNIGVTGASGFLGTALLRHLGPCTEHRVSALTRTLTIEGAESDATWVQGDLSSPVDAAAFVDDLDVVVHLAGTSTPLLSSAHLATDVVANLIPTVTLLQAIRDRGRRPHVVFASSGGTVYAPITEHRPLSESALLGPLSSYGVQKLAAEAYLRLSAQLGWLTATVLRIGNPYGTLLPPERLQGFIGVALHQIVKRQPVRLIGDARNVRDFIHLDDVCRMFTSTLEPTRPFEIYNVGTGVGHSVNDVLALLEEIIGRPVDVRREGVPGDEQHLPSWIVLDSGKAARELGWRASVSLTEGLHRLGTTAGVARVSMIGTQAGDRMSRGN